MDMLMTVRWVFLLPWLILTCVQGTPTLFKTQPRVEVKKGRTLYLEPKDIFQSIEGLVEGNTSCRMQVKQDEPLSLKMGDLYPRTFDCNFSKSTVKYTHSGSPVLKQDTIIFQVYVFGKLKTVQHIIKLQIAVVEADYDIIVMDSTRQPLEVSHEKWLSAPIDTSVINFKYSFNHGTYCSISYTEYKSQWPLVGHIVGGLDKDYIQDFNEDCSDFLYKGYHYEYLGGLSPQMDYIPLRLKFYNGVSSDDKPIEESIFLPIKILTTKPNSVPTVSNKTVTIEVDEYKMEIIDSVLIQAWDEETASEYIMYNITYPATPSLTETGYFVNVNDPMTAITSFYQRDLTVGMIGYLPRVRTLQKRRKGVVMYESLMFVLHAFDTHFESSQPIDINVIIKIDESVHEPVVIPGALVVNEGESTRLSADYFIFPQTLKLDETRFQVKGGLKHGKVQINGTIIEKFTYSNLVNREVEYIHDGSESPEDRIALKITDGKYNTKKRFPVTVLPREDSGPFVVANKGLEVKAGQYVQIKKSLLCARDRDSPEEDIIYKIKMPPLLGEITKVYHPFSQGIPISHFTQKDINIGYIYYHHFGKGDSNSVNSKEISDTFEFTLSDSSNPPNKSGKNTVSVKISPSSGSTPKWESTSSRELIIKETDIAYITNELLHYSSHRSNEKVQYTIIKQPFFQTSTMTMDAGRIIAAKNVSSFNVKDPKIPAIWNFDQEQIDDWQISYMPPIKDIGPIRRRAEFEFSVTDSDGNCAMAQKFSILLLPVNNQIPYITVSEINVVEGETVPITGKHISAYDPDTDQKNLLFTLKEGPKFGQLLKEDYRMVVGEEFHLADLGNGIIRYEHDGSEFPDDSFLLSVSDGANVVSKEVPVSIEIITLDVPVNDAAAVEVQVASHPKLRYLETNVKGSKGSKNNENGTSVTDNDDSADILTTDDVLDSTKVQQLHDEITAGGIPHTEAMIPAEIKESHQDLHASRKNKNHKDQGKGVNKDGIGKEHYEDKNDDVSISDDEYMSHDAGVNVEGYVYDSKEVVVNFDYTKKQVLEIEEGGEGVITLVNLAMSPDSPTELQSRFVLLSPGYGDILLDNQKISEFKIKDVKEGRIKYIHTSGEIGLSPKYDIVTLSIIDHSVSSIFNAPLVDMNVTIYPVDNQMPSVILGGPVFVQEGETVDLTLEMLNAQDIDTELTDLKFYISEKPVYGYLENINARPKDGQTVTRAIDSFNYKELKRGHVSYVQANHTGIEPAEDFFEVYVSDGIQNSIPAQVRIEIIPVNDEMPQFRVTEIFVDEGGKTDLPAEYIKASDADRPNQRLVLSLAEKPRYGELVIMLPSPTGKGDGLELPMYDVTMDDLQKGRIILVYKHDSSENFKDQFILKLTDGIHVTRAMGRVKVVPHNDEHPVIVRNSVLSVDFGGSALMTPTVLQIVDDDSEVEDIMYIIVTPPKKGMLQKKVDADVAYTASFLTYFASSEVEDKDWQELKQGGNFTQADINSDDVRYVHTGNGNDETELHRGHSHDTGNFDGFVFEVNDGMNSIPPVSFDIEIIQSQNINIALLTRGIKVKEGDTQIMTSNELSASDGSSLPEELVYTVTSSPRFGKLGLLTDKAVTIHTFTQADLEAQKIMYTHTSKVDVHEDIFKFTVMNRRNHSRTGLFKILIEPVDRILPMLVKNMPLTVVQDDSATLTQFNLLISDPDTPPSNLTYIIVEPPQYGVLLNDGAVVMEFTQFEVDRGLVKYKNAGSNEAGVDYFLFTITDGHNNGFTINGTFERKAAFFNILVQPPEKKPPKMVNVVPPTTLESLGGGKFGFIFTNENLKATHPKSSNQDIVYAIIEKPQHGYLQNMGEFRPIKKKFTQKDVDEGNVAFFLEDDIHATNDSFVFRVYDDVSQNTLEDQSFQMSWSVIEFDQTLHIVCEDAEILLIVLRRHGSTNGTATAEIKVKGMSAKEGIDYKLLSSKMIEFGPGVEYLPIDVKIHNDGLYESNEKFRAKLKNAKNAVIGPNEKTIVQIINLNNGKCDEYIGMISRHRRDPLNWGYEKLFPGRTYPTPAPTTTTPQPTTTTTTRPFDIFEIGKHYYEEKSPQKGAEYELPTKFPIAVEIETLNSDEKSKGKDYIRNKTHPLKKYKEDRKSRKAKNKKRKDKNHLGHNSKLGFTPVPVVTTVAPQPCTEDTKGLLYFDLVSSKIYKCSGKEWQRWDWGPGYFSSMLRDAASDDTQTDVQDSDGSSEVIIENRGQDVAAVENDETENIDGCPKDWHRYGDDCYIIPVDRHNWEDSEKQCMELGGHLADVSSDKHNAWLWKLSQKHKFWIGLSNRGNVDWVYTNGAPVRYFNWKSGYPRAGRNRRYTGKECVLIIGKSWWVNRPCDRSRANYLCSKPAEGELDEPNFPSWYSL